MTDQAKTVEGSATEIPDAEIVPEPEEHQREEEPSRAAGLELELRSEAAGSTALIQGADPDEILAKAAKIATAFKSVVDQQGLSTRIGSKDHVEIEAWQTLATLLGCAPIVRWTRRVEDPETGKPERIEYEVHVKDYEWVAPEGGGKKQKRVKAERDYTVSGYNWEAYCEVLKDGILIASAESMCGREEDKWANDPDFALRSMAQTRAQSRAISAAARWVTTLAGFAGTPAEEMDHVAERPVFAERGSEELEKIAKKWLVALLGGDKVAASKIWKKVEATPANGDPQEALGYVPRVAAQTMIEICSAIHELRSGAGTIEIGTPSDEKPDRVSEEKARELCRCPEGFDAAQQDDGKRSGSCPIKGHGIPF